jgi:glyoxylase-like metal-dependent hydrolase (beta-lactamase superfamily II)
MIPTRRHLPRLFLILLCLPLAAEEIVPDVHVIRGGFVPGSQPDGNSVIFESADGLIVVDTGRHEQHTRQILDLARSLKKPISVVVNTHWHLDHIGGNLMIRKEHPDVRVLASGALSGALKGFLANYRKQLQERNATSGDIRLIDAGAQLAPTEVVTSTKRKTIGGRSMVIGLEDDAVTAGDVWVLDDTSGVLVAGDLVTLPAPFLDTAVPQGWSSALERIARTQFDLLIPGHGAPLTRRQFFAYREAFNALIDCKAVKNQCIESWMQATAPLVTDRDDKFTREMMSYYVDLLRK